ncbi:MAG: ribosome biogenesis GTPase Der [Holosporales bacterium]|jgi:GTP-binding protein|nr:ribosome biogenesis GTPase Der [Holosporales bacterium]
MSIHLGKVVLLGPPNVGKSALFNKLAGKHAAIVFDMPGVTRDCHETRIQLPDDYPARRQRIRRVEPKLRGPEITLVDMPGALNTSWDAKKAISDTSELSSDSDLDAAIQRQIVKSVSDADLILFVTAGNDAVPEQMFNKARTFGKTMLFLVNKCDLISKNTDLSQIYKLGAEPVFVSAEHGIGISELWELIEASLRQELNAPDEEDDSILIEKNGQEDDFDDENEEGHSAKRQTKKTRSVHSNEKVKISIIGRPNVGKSTLINAMLNREAQVTANVPGTTRDTVEYDFEYKNQGFLISDTAGIRRNAKVDSRLEKISVSHAINSINFSHVCILVIDALELEGTDYKEFVQQDLLLASKAEKEGRCVVIALNKWDLVKNKRSLRLNIEEYIRNNNLKYISVAPISAKRNEGISGLLDAVTIAAKEWNTRLPTARVNKWLRDFVFRNPPPATSIRRSKLKYITQVGTRPLRFVIFGTKIDDVPKNYRQFLENQLRQTFQLDKTPIRISWRQQENPYIKDRRMR